MNNILGTVLASILVIWAIIVVGVEVVKYVLHFYLKRKGWIVVRYGVGHFHNFHYEYYYTKGNNNELTIWDAFRREYEMQ